MSAAVKLSVKHARELVRFFDDATGAGQFGAPPSFAAIDALRRSVDVAPRQKSSAVRKTERKRRAKRDELAGVLEVIKPRANGRCEACGWQFSKFAICDPDHFFGTAKAEQSPETIWLICRACHTEKTDNSPSALWWLAKFREHCLRHGYHVEARKTEARMDFERAKRGGE